MAVMNQPFSRELFKHGEIRVLSGKLLCIAIESVVAGRKWQYMGLENMLCKLNISLMLSLRLLWVRYGLEKEVNE